MTWVFTYENYVSRQLRRRLSRQVEGRTTPPQDNLEHLNARYPGSWCLVDHELPLFLPGMHPTPVNGSFAGGQCVRRPRTGRTRWSI